jgi:hypothetical protein
MYENGGEAARRAYGLQRLDTPIQPNCQDESRIPGCPLKIFVYTQRLSLESVK